MPPPKPPQPKPSPSQPRQAPPRLGAPRPLLLHLQTALTTWLSLPIVWPILNGSLPNSKLSSVPLLAAFQEKLKPLFDQGGPSPEALDLFKNAIEHEARFRFHAFLRGVRAYQTHPARRSLPAKPIVWQKGSTKLRRYGDPKNEGAKRVLVIPSLVNRFDILDLDKGLSFLRFLALKKLDVYVVDWDAPSGDEQEFTLADYLEKRLLPILDFLSEGGESVSVVGYCMGGLLSLALAALAPKKVRALSLIATPWDFEAGARAEREAFSKLALAVEPWLADENLLPVDVLQTIFSGFQPIGVLQKFARFADRDPEGRESRRFVLAEDWLNDGVPLVRGVTREVLKVWYEENSTQKNAWSVRNQIIDPRQITTPAYVIVAGKDKIVAPQSSRPLAKSLPNATLLERDFGHIGLMTSLPAREEIWKPLAVWLLKT